MIYPLAPDFFRCQNISPDFPISLRYVVELGNAGNNEDLR